jgi:hypothetical protein
VRAAVERHGEVLGLGESGQRGDGSFSTFALTPVAVNGLTGPSARGRIWPRLRAALERDDALLGREP